MGLEQMSFDGPSLPMNRAEPARLAAAGTLVTDERLGTVVCAGGG